MRRAIGPSAGGAAGGAALNGLFADGEGEAPGRPRGRVRRWSAAVMTCGAFRRARPAPPRSGRRRCPGAPHRLRRPLVEHEHGLPSGPASRTTHRPGPPAALRAAAARAALRRACRPPAGARPSRRPRARRRRPRRVRRRRLAWATKPSGRKRSAAAGSAARRGSARPATRWRSCRASAAGPCCPR